MYPLKFRPILKSLVWGGEKIAPFKGIETDQDHIGESWELSGVKGNESVIANGEYAGLTISELIARFKSELIGENNYRKTGTEFPLLIKFIDARQDLSIQVHPNDELAAQREPGKKGKTEMWYVVGADEGAHLRSGLSQKITPQEYEAMIADNSITDVLCRYDISKGDVFFLPAGRIHSIGAGAFIAEIQQTSDITYRIYDFGRVGLDGKPRELHTEQSKAAIDYTVCPDYRTAYERKDNSECLLVDCDYFTTSLLPIDKPFEKDLSGMDSFLVVICTLGKGTLTDGEGNTESFHQGETILIPASCQGIRICPDGYSELLTSYIL